MIQGFRSKARCLASPLLHIVNRCTMPIASSTSPRPEPNHGHKQLVQYHCLPRESVEININARHRAHARQDGKPTSLFVAPSGSFGAAYTVRSHEVKISSRSLRPATGYSTATTACLVRLVQTQTIFGHSKTSHRRRSGQQPRGYHERR